MKARVAALVTLVGILATLIVFVLGDSADAKPQPGFLPKFESTYPAAVGSRIDSCVLCHNIVGTEYKLNDYAKQWKEGQDFIAINNLDADGDGFSNLEEINAHTFPGNASDNPNTVVTTTTVPGATTTTAAPGSGGAIFQSNCASCHGGNGGNLLGRTLTLNRITTVVTNGTTGMSGFNGRLTSGEIQTVSQWLFNLISAPATTTTTIPGTPPPPPPSGSTLFAASCQGCHGANGGDLAGTTLSRTQLVNTITNGTTTGMPSFNSTYNSTQIGAIADYLLSLTPPATTTTTTIPGTPPPPPPSGATVFTNNCASCHGASGGNLVGRTITTSQIATVVNNGTTGMPGFSTRLSQAERDAVVGYVAGKTSSTTTTVPGTPPPPPPSGFSVFANNCASCHGPSGGNLVGRTITTSQIATVVNNGTTGMPGFNTRLSQAERDAVVGYVAGKTSSTTTTTAPGSPPPSGSDVFATNCATCHGASGGDLVGHVLTDAQLSSAVVNGKGASMPSFGSRLDSAQINAVVAYLSSLGSNASTPAGVVGAVDGTSLYVTFCSACHGPHGEGGSAGPLAGTTLVRSELISVIGNGQGTMPGFSDRMATEEMSAVADFVLNSFSSNSAAETGSLTLAAPAAGDQSDGGGATPAADSPTRSLFSNEAGRANDSVPGPSSNERLYFLVLLGLLMTSGAGFLWVRYGRTLESQKPA